jgi:hypothetical protein
MAHKKLGPPAPAAIGAPSGGTTISAGLIKTPAGKIEILGNGKAELSWNPNFVPKWQKKFNAVQYYVDSEVLRLCEPYIPLRSGMLVMSGILGTKLGSGKVTWIAPYSHRQYYATRKPGSETGPLRGPFWFERMKAVSGKQIIAGARKVMSEQSPTMPSAPMPSASGMQPLTQNEADEFAKKMGY